MTHEFGEPDLVGKESEKESQGQTNHATQHRTSNFKYNSIKGAGKRDALRWLKAKKKGLARLMRISRLLSFSVQISKENGGLFSFVMTGLSKKKGHICDAL